MTHRITLAQVVEHFGGAKALADELGTTRQAIQQWAGGIPANRAIEIERLSEGRFKAVNLPIRRPRKRGPRAA